MVCLYTYVSNGSGNAMGDDIVKCLRLKWI